MQCVPLGTPALKANAEMNVDFFKRADPGLMLNDVSVEWALLARLCSVPSVKVRMHGDRSDASHIAAYQACADMIAPYHPELEQDDFPDWAARRACSGRLACQQRPMAAGHRGGQPPGHGASETSVRSRRAEKDRGPSHPPGSRPLGKRFLGELRRTVPG